MNIIEEYLNKHPKALDVRPEFKKADGMIDTDKLLEAFTDEAIKLIRETIEKSAIGTPRLKIEAEAVIEYVKTGEIAKEDFIMMALSRESVRAILVKRWEERTMFKSNKTRH